jgi:hypothetical protein
MYVATVIELKDGTIHNSLLAIDISVGGLFFEPEAGPRTRICVVKGVPTA